MGIPSALSYRQTERGLVGENIDQPQWKQNILKEKFFLFPYRKKMNCNKKSSYEVSDYEIRSILSNNSDEKKVTAFTRHLNTCLKMARNTRRQKKKKGLARIYSLLLWLLEEQRPLFLAWSEGPQLCSVAALRINFFLENLEPEDPEVSTLIQPTLNRYLDSWNSLCSKIIRIQSWYRKIYQKNRFKLYLASLSILSQKRLTPELIEMILIQI